MRIPTYKPKTKSNPKYMSDVLATIAPTGTISIIAGTSSGIEPPFALAYARHVLERAKLLEVSPLFESAARSRGIYSQELKTEIAKKGSVRDIPGVPQDLKELFVTASGHAARAARANSSGIPEAYR
jgi:ribonucleoside-diphosphate reductase alpha chain